MVRRIAVFHLAVALCAACWGVATDRTAWAADAAGSAGSAATAASVADAPPIEISPLATQGPKPKPIDPPSPEQLQKAIERGVDFLLQTQMEIGAWGSARKTKGLNIYAPVPGSHHAFRTAVTGLVISALLEAQPYLDDQRRKAIDEAVDRGQAWLLEHAGTLRRAEAEAIYNVWGHAYSIVALEQLYRRAEGDAALQDKLKLLVEYQVDMLARYSFINGGWSYYDTDAHTQRPGSSPFSFTTATVLIALKDAEKLGVEFPEKLAKEAMASLRRQRFPDFAYAYGEYLRMMPRLGINRPAGSLGRSQVCNLAMRMYGDRAVTDEVIEAWLNRLIARDGWLSIGRKRPIPHESYFQIAGYFYYYGYYYAAMCVEQLPEAERPHFQDHLAHILLPLQEKDGSWWDYPLYNYHQQWGTAMTVSALVRCRHGDADEPVAASQTSVSSAE